MEIIYKPEQESLNRLAVSILCKKTKEILKDKEYAVWALPGGRSVGGIFNILSNREDLDWSRVHFFMTDERLVPIEDDTSNFKLVLKKLFYPLLERRSISNKNIHPFIYRPGSKDAGLGIYKEKLIKLQDFYDITLLSSGEDGHIAGLFPGHETIKDDSDFYIKTDDSPKPPPGRMSSSRKLLARSVTVLLLFYGHDKKQAYDKFMKVEQSVEKCPARLVLEVKDSFVLTDQK
jgi:6-phosphogluconolactonase